MNISWVQANELWSVWPKLVPQIRHGLHRGIGDTLTERRLYNGVMEGELDLWVIHTNVEEILAGIFLLIEERERGKALVVLDVVAGSGHGFREYAEEMLPRFREYAEMIGAYTIEAYCRRGVARELQRLGCKTKAVIMEMSNGRRRS